MIEYGLSPFPENYDFYSEGAREQFERKFKLNFMNLTIAFETTGLYYLKFEAIMSKIMPHYTHLFNQRITELDLVNVDIRQITDREVKGEGKSNSTTQSQGSSNNKNKSKSLDTPDNAINENDISKFITYADQSEGTQGTTSQGTGSSLSETSQNEQVELHEIGYRGSLTKAELKNALAKTFYNLDQMILNDLDVLFMHY